ncbi:hypothetical protein SPI_05214 [Niveomyces insectorum RCEF 264]|uniref:Uncharacterized protein n=1 Tax=Niveomyces insectorum RCEF 264 TaxID=1081102 RepID=A0A167U2U9_9HYPO|nr:hypothetical protein SPI_05214 [Niveomyces insectorum RCEF 264]
MPCCAFDTRKDGTDTSQARRPLLPDEPRALPPDAPAASTLRRLTRLLFFVPASVASAPVAGSDAAAYSRSAEHVCRGQAFSLSRSGTVSTAATDDTAAEENNQEDHEDAVKDEDDRDEMGKFSDE